MELCTEVGLTKIASGKKVYDKEREMQKLATLSQMADPMNLIRENHRTV